jgi:hypothetical protein
VGAEEPFARRRANDPPPVLPPGPGGHKAVVKAAFRAMRTSASTSTLPKRRLRSRMLVRNALPLKHAIYVSLRRNGDASLSAAPSSPTGRPISFSDLMDEAAVLSAPCSTATPLGD